MKTGKRQGGGGRWKNVVGNVERSRRLRRPRQVATTVEPAKKRIKIGGRARKGRGKTRRKWRRSERK